MPAQPGEQLALALGGHEGPRLLSEHFLTERLPTWPEFHSGGDDRLLSELRQLWSAESGTLATANEAQTEERWIKPVLAALGFEFTVQAGLTVTAGHRQPDYALFLSAEDRRAADALGGASRYERAVAVADAKAYARRLDGRSRDGTLSEDPAAQIIQYVLVTRRRWGILTNGRLWRLYATDGDLVGGACHQVDLVALIESADLGAFRYFSALFSAAAFRTGADGRSFLERVVADSEAHARRVGDELQRQVFAAVPGVAAGLTGGEERSSEALAEAYENALVVLFRLLFCLYAEARGLLPVDNPHYRDYSLQVHKVELAHDLDRGRVFSARSDDLYNDLRGLFGIVGRGDPALGVTEYNGRLFSAAAHAYLAQRTVPDSLLAPALDAIYRVGGEFIDYRDLSPRQLGTIYERLLDFRLVEAQGRLVLEPAPGRHDTGSYYTPEHVVDAIVEATLGPLLERRSREVMTAGLRGEEALERLLRIRVADPAMGSGHFLVSACSYIALAAATDPSYDGELPLEEIRRLVAERCLYGVDLNPMAVELAQLSLWLATVRRDEPLAFLENLRVGNSLVGVTLAELLTGEDSLFAQRLGRDAEDLLSGAAAIVERPSVSADDVHEKERLAADVDALREPLTAIADDLLAPNFTETGGRFFHWELEFPEVFLTAEGEAREGGGFDAVVGNPPYIRIQDLGRELAAFCRRRYVTASGSFDVYIPFLERGVELLGPMGRLGFILPNKFLKLEYATRLREQLAGQRLVDEVIDFGDAQVFAAATNYTCVLVLDRAGRDELTYRRVQGDAAAVEEALLRPQSIPAARFAANGLGGGPWIMATGEEEALLRAVAAGSERLGDVTRQIFQGLITSADPVYVLEDRGVRGGRRRVWSRASERELELEPDLLRPLASGRDVDRHAFHPLRQLLLFPYRRGDDGAMRLLDEAELTALPLTDAYLREHEATLRGREGGRMDHGGWYAFGRTQNLGLHDLPKLGCAATVRRLELAVDPDGAVYFHNVRVNGILPREDAPSIWVLSTLLNSRLLDYVFRRGAAEHAGRHYAANKQFISPLPIRLPASDVADELADLGRRLHETTSAIGAERKGFLDWLEGTVGARVATLRGGTTLTAYEDHDLDAVVAVLAANSSRIRVDPQTRATRERLEREMSASVERLDELRRRLGADERAADAEVYDLYQLTDAQRALVDGEYES